MISWPGKVKPRRDKEHLASNVDLWPTLAALLKTPLPKGLPGIELTDVRTVGRRTAVFGEQYAHNIADVAEPTRSLEHRWLIDGWWKLIVPNSRKQPGEAAELYNLRDDPWEMNNLTAKEPGRVKELARQLDEGWKPSLPL